VVTKQVSDPLIGRMLGEFIIREKLGEGGFGIVYRAEQLTLAREAVIKVLHAKHRSNRRVIERFMREARLASRLEHPYTAHVYAFGAEPDGLLWIAMELVHGTPFDRLLKSQGPLSLERFVPLLDKICEVVHTGHDCGIIHRDLKPANVMVISRAGRLLPKLLDFGIAKGLDKKTESREPVEEAGDSMEIEPDLKGSDTDPLLPADRTAGAVGSPYYMAPEVWENAAEADARSDIYALGVLSYEAITGRPPFQGTRYSLAYAHSSRPVPQLGPPFPAALDKVMEKVLAKEPVDRYSTAIEFAADFRAAAGFAEQTAGLPKLDEPLRERLLAAAPQPLAEAVANLGTARNARHARDQIMEIFRITIRYIGLLALCSKARLAESRTEPIAQSLRKLRRDGLDEEEWLELAEEICRPFVQQPDAYPIPELVSLLFEQGGGRRSVRSEIFEPLLEMQRAAARSASGTEEQVRELLALHLPQLAALLRALLPLFDYPLVVPRSDHLELWAGLTRERSNLPAMGRRQLEEGRPVLVDPEGRAVLSL
jgi:serine/threonine protein kinase